MWLKPCFQLWEQTNPETSLCHISSSWPCPIACADYSAMPIGNLSGCHHTVDTENTNMHAQHSRGQASTIVHASSTFLFSSHHVTPIYSIPGELNDASAVTLISNGRCWHSVIYCCPTVNCHHAQDYRQRIWSIRKATKHSLRCEYGILSIKREWFIHRAPLQVYWSFSTCKITQPYLQPLLFRVLFLLQCHYSLLEDESQIGECFGARYLILWNHVLSQ